MKVYPAYYPEFHCLAGACRHSCCVGWEIGVDEESFARYRSHDGELGDRLRAALSEEGGAHFVLTEGERCPFLNKDGLCDLILAEGPDTLCQICRDHPRFRNFFPGITEIGLGLCCEEAARLILTKTEPMTFLTAEDGDCPVPDEETEAFFALRQKVFSLAQDRSRPLFDRENAILALFGVSLPQTPLQDRAALLYELERMDSRWTEILNQAETAPEIPFSGDETPFEQLLCAFLFRHLAAGCDDGDFAGKAAFSVFSTRFLRDLTAALSLDLLEAARLFSAEIEYSDENLFALYDLFAP